MASALLFASVFGSRAPDAAVVDVDVYVAGEIVNPLPDGARRTRKLEIVDADSRLMRVLMPAWRERLDALKSLPPQTLIDGFISGLKPTLPLGLILFLPVHETMFAKAYRTGGAIIGITSRPFRR